MFKRTWGCKLRCEECDTKNERETNEKKKKKDYNRTLTDNGKKESRQRGILSFERYAQGFLGVFFIMVMHDLGNTFFVVGVKKIKKAPEKKRKKIDFVSL